ncbi:MULTISPECIES: sugar ABC transporter permease [unclassified Oceanispirochaeta]|uniref:sugar ABC transporter permease n=1 Tax=unclassified Oceanispirochaeta TaxID=2635722 RepID=UPI001313EE51|nr:MULTISPECIES: sugar ABC transporter permease [unclassified Oceanispirochaeta]MBF9018457.1 sugar ABC transporter permease [Oceanispirochaeta sp. M2]NPD73909.1 sugar ABC transporter permease [Oceanispirochaeta sp. M1]
MVEDRNVFQQFGWVIYKYFLTLISMLRTNIRDFGMFIALIVIFVIFQFMTNGIFLGAFNFTNLLNQSAYVAVLAVGMTLVIVTQQIDLSVGYIGAFLGAYVVVAVETGGQPVILALLGALVITIIVGIIKGYFVAKIKVPSFVVTLAGMFIFKGLLFFKTNNRTISTTNDFFIKVGIGYLPTYDVSGYDLFSLISGAVIIIAAITSGILTRKKHAKLGIPSEKVELFITKIFLLSVVIGYLTYTFASNKGISYLLLITVVVVVIYHFMSTQTTLGRRIYAVGGNPEAAELSGISVEKTIIIVFVSMGITAMIAGIMYVSRLENASPKHGPFWELYAIAAVFIGGTSAKGGIGKVVNAVVGAVVIISLKNGMSLAGIDANIEPIILGSVLLFAVVFDIYTRNVMPVDLVGMHYARKENKAELLLARDNFFKAKRELQEAEKENRQDLIEYEYKFTNAQGVFNKIKDKIRVSVEADFIKE